jgi:DNA repair protein SbcD/Mre11
MIRFIHTADVHFGVENYGRIDAKSGIHSRLLDFYRALNFCVDRAISEEVDFFLFSGDAYKTAHPSPTQQRLLCDCFLRLFKAGIPLVIVVGNHDNPLSFGKAHALELFDQLPLDGFHVIAKPTSFILNTKHGPVQLVGIPWPSRATLALGNDNSYSPTDLSKYISRSLATIIHSYAERLDRQLPAVLAGHFTISSGIFSGSEKRTLYGNDPMLLPSQVAIEPFDYIALGHLHRHQNLNLHGHPPLVYAGSLERIDFGERHDIKGFCLVTIHDKYKTTYEFIPSPTRRFLQFDIQLEGTEHHTDQILHALEQQPLEGSVVKIVYHLPSTKDNVDVTALQQACIPAHYIAGIVPVRKLADPHQRRISLDANKGLEALLDAYLQLKPEWRDQRAHLIEKAHALQVELEHEL